MHELHDEPIAAHTTMRGGGPAARLVVVETPAEVVADWAGDAGRVVEFGTRFTKPVVVPVAGSELVVQGVVKVVDAETGRVTVDITTTSGGEKVLGRCLAVVRLS